MNAVADAKARADAAKANVEAMILGTKQVKFQIAGFTFPAVST
jgi:hypothetical protein